MSSRRLNVVVERDIPVPMRDGVRLSADLFRPSEGGPYPVLLMRTPYDKTGAQFELYEHAHQYARRGFVVVIQDCRGRWRSEGEWYPFVNESRDGRDTIAWAATLPGTTGKVGMYGASYVGATQLLAAVESPPALACICPAITASDYFEGWTYEGGAFHLAFIENWSVVLAQDTARHQSRPDLEEALFAAHRDIHGHYWHLPLSEFPPHLEAGMAPYFFDWLEHSSDDAYWRQIAPKRRYERVKTPALHIGGWYDIFLAGTLENYQGISATGADEATRAGQRLIVGPWYHFPWSPRVGELDFGRQADGDIVDDQQLRFYDWRLKGIDDGISSEPPVKLFVMGENVWRDEASWPLARSVATRYYLHSDGRANSFAGNGMLSPSLPADEPYDTFIYDPLSPSMSRGGHSCCFEDVVPQGPYDQRPVERFHGILCFTSEILSEPLEVTGPVTATLWAATTAVDTDWVVKLIDVHPDGRAINLTEGILRARFRHGLDRPTLLEPEEIVRYEISLRATSNVFLPGHRIRVDVNSSSFPHWDRNPNTGQPLGVARLTEHRKATQTIFHDQARPSHLTLPVVPR